MFLTLGGRYDFASAFGEESPGVFYPKASLSVVPSDLGGWRSPLGINTLRVRFAMGQSGRAPGGFDKFTTFAPLRAETGAGLAPSQLGNQSLEPARRNRAHLAGGSLIRVASWRRRAPRRRI